MDYLLEISKLCKCSVSVNINDHRNGYETAAERIKERDQWFAEVPEDVKAIMIETDTIIEVQAYPKTPIGFIVVCHYDLSEALKLTYEYLVGNHSN